MLLALFWYCGEIETADPHACIDRRAFSANIVHSPDVDLLLASVADVGLTLKQRWMSALLEYYP